MCGIAGYYGQKSPFLLREMLHSIRHRGPDDEGIFLDANVGLGIKRLAIVDAKTGHQPIYNEDRTLCIVLNGEVYNYSEIKDELKDLGHTFLTNTDTEVVLHAYEEWREDCLQKLNGMFAFAIWSQGNSSLFIARDRLGIKPLYYHHDAKGFTFASEIKALLVDEDMIREPNDPAILSFLMTGFQNTSETFFRQIKELHPGHFMIVNSEGPKVSKYWDIPKERRRLKHDRSMIDRFLALLLDAIKIRIPPNLSITYYLSGGLDSSAIVCLTNSIQSGKYREKNENTILTASYDSAWDEAPYSEEVGRFLDANITYVYPSSAVTWKDLKTFVYHIDEPVTVLNYYAYWCLARVTKGKSKIIFMGQGPDEFLAGHGDHFISYLKELVKKRKTARIVAELIRGAKRYEIFSVLYVLVRDFALSSRYRYIRELLDKEFFESHNRAAETGPRPHSLRESLLQDVKKERLPMHLRVGDRMASAFSIELRCPYLDHRIIEYSFTLPSDYKIRNGATKYVLREAVKGAVPESVRKRKKLGTPVPLESWLKKFRSDITQMMRSRKFRERGYFNAGAVSDMFDRYCKDRMNRFEKEFYGDVLWRIINLELWFEAFFD